MSRTQSAVKRVRVSRHWFWFYFLLDEKVARVFKPIVWQSDLKPVTFRHSNANSSFCV